ncbi:MAG: PQQ-binding-like beta-propeller repeat protein, partial [Deltaproteobacteria bacterium]
ALGVTARGCASDHGRPRALRSVLPSSLRATIPPPRPVLVEGAAARYENPRAESADHDLGERIAPRPLPIPRVAEGRTATFQFDGFHRGWVAQFDRTALLATPAFANGKVYVGAGFHSTTVYAFDAHTGALRWTGQTPDGGPTAAIVDDGKVLFNTESCTLFAFDVASGALRWSHYLGDPLMSQPAAARGLVYSAYPDRTSAGGFSFAAMSMRTGEFVWTLPIHADVLTAPVIDGDAVYFTTMDGNAWRVGARSGRVAWVRALSATSAPSVEGGVMYVAQRAAHASERQMVLDAASGRTLSRSDPVAAPYASHRADVGGTEAGWAYEGSRPSYADGRLYYAMGHDLVARDATSGREVWRRNYPASIAARGMTSPSVVGGQLVVGTHDGKLFGIDIDTGATTWAYDVGEPIAFQPAVANGWVYATTSRGKVIGLEVGDRSFDGWHMWGGNARHTGLSAHATEASPPDEPARPTEGTLRATAGTTHLRDGEHAFPLMHTRVTAHVSGFVARVEVEQEFDNPFDRAIDAEYLFPLPADSAVDGLDLHVGPRVIHGEISLREQARA